MRGGREKGFWWLDANLVPAVEAREASRNGGNQIGKFGSVHQGLSCLEGFAFPFHFMQVRFSSLKGNRPCCPVDPNHAVDCHGVYRRCADCNDNDKKEAVDRYLCRPCGRTISVLPDHFLPYRAPAVDLVQKHFDAQANPGEAEEPPATEKEKGCLKRAWARFKQRVAPLKARLGQMIRSVKPSAAQLWNQLRRTSNLSAILLQLAHPFNLSLLHDYLCLLPWGSD